MFAMKPYYHYCKLILLSLILAFFSSSEIYSSPAYPKVITFVQPDGTKVKLTLYGDEDLRWAVTEDGYTLIADEEGYFTYAEKDSKGNLVASKIRATQPEKRSETAKIMLGKVGKGIGFSELQIETSVKSKAARYQSMKFINDTEFAKGRKVASASQKIEGVRKQLLLLVDFPDKPFSLTKNDFDKIMNAEHNVNESARDASVRDYYREASFGQLDLQTVVMGVYRMQHPLAYYGGNGDQNAKEMVLEALAQANESIDFSQFDNDGDGTVDGVHVIYAGYGEEAGGGSDCIWAHSSGIYATYDGVNFNRYSCSPELRGNNGKKITSIGVICHEIGHVLGTMDFYDTDYAIGGQYGGTGTWDLMGSGSWNGDGDSPAMLNPYTTIYDFGWSEVIEVNSSASIELKARSRGQYVRINTATKGEYFLIENRQNVGFDRTHIGHGLIIYRATDDLSKRWNNAINTRHPQQFYIVSANAPADIPVTNPSSYGSINSTSCPFPGSNNVREFTDYTTPSMKSWSGFETNLPITEIEEDLMLGTVSFDVAGGSHNGAYKLSISDSGDDFVSVVWKNAKAGAKMMLLRNSEASFGKPEGASYGIGDEIDGGGKVVYLGGDTCFVDKGLENQTMYYYSVYTYDEETHRWYNGGIKSVSTSGVIRKFPYVENFSSLIINKSWELKNIVGKADWSIIPYTDGNYLSIDDKGRENVADTRVLLPVMDFSNYKRALIQLQYVNGLDYASVYYRKSVNDKWIKLKDLDHSEYKQDWNYTNIFVDDLSEQMQISIVCFINRKNNGGWSGFEVFDMKEISVIPEESGEAYFVDEDMLTSIENDYVVIGGNVAQTFGNEIIEQGIAISENMDLLKKYSNETTEGVTLFKKTSGEGEWRIDGLTPGKRYYYMYYYKTNTGDAYSPVIGMFNTIALKKGRGTKADPYIIENVDDWINFRESHNGLKNRYIELRSDIKLTSNVVPFETKKSYSGYFYGHLDGNNHTVTYSGTDRFDNICSVLEKGATIKNINIVQERGEMATISNYGLIENVNVYYNEIKYDFSRKTGFSYYNYGEIKNCEVHFPTDTVMMRESSCFVEKNYGIITNCRSYGNLKGRKIGGLVYDNLGGIIRNCINYANICSTDDEAEKAGGIAFYNNSYLGKNGIIDCCVNYGELRNPRTAGIVFTNNVLVTNCYNAGSYVSGGYEKKTGNATIVYNGIGSGHIENCLFVGSIENYNTKEAGYFILGGQTDNSKNNYYTGDYEDNYAVRISQYMLNSQTFVDELNRNANADVWTLKNGKLKLRMETDETDVPPLLNVYVSEVRSDRISLEVVNSNSSETDVLFELKKVQDKDWQTVTAVNRKTNNVTIDGLDPYELYDVRVCVVAPESKKLLTSSTVRFATYFLEDTDIPDTLQVADYTTLLKLGHLVSQGHNFKDMVLLLTADIDLGGKEGREWTAIGGHLIGTLDGNGHTLHNMHSRNGFMLYADDIRNLHFRDAYIESSGPVGGIVLRGNVNQCSIHGVLKGVQLSSIAREGSIEDCYAAVDMYCDDALYYCVGYTSNIKNSYFAGTVNYERNNGLNIIKESDERYLYYSDSKKSEKKMKKDEMVSGVLLAKLNKDIWMADNATDPVNNGYPVLCNQGKSFISTLEPQEDAFGRYHLNGIYSRGIDRHDTMFGIEWYYDEDGGKKVNRFETNDKDSIGVVIKDMKVSTPYFYRAFAANAANDTIYGEWVSFERWHTAPCLFIDSIVSNGSNGDATLTYGINKGDDVIRDMEIEYHPKYDPSNVKRFSIGRDNKEVKLTDLNAHTIYVAKLIGISFFENKYVSDSVQWMTPAYGQEYYAGDANYDGGISVVDVISTVGYIKNKKPAGFNVINADVNNDEIIDMQDMLMIKDLVLNSKMPGGDKQADDDVRFSIVRDSIYAAQLEIQVEHSSAAPLYGYSFDLVLPKFTAVTDVTAVSEENSMFTYYKQFGDTTRIVVYSWENIPVSCNASGKANIRVDINDMYFLQYENINVKLINGRAVDSEFREKIIADVSAVVPINDECLINGLFYSFDYKKRIANITTRYKGQYPSHIVIPSKVTYQGDVYEVGELKSFNFGTNSTIESVVFEAPLTTIPNGLFRGCSKLNEVKLPETLTTIGSSAFDLTNLTELYLPASVTSIAGTIGEKCENNNSMGYMKELKSITVAKDNPCYKDIDGVLFTKDGKQVIKIPAKRANIYEIPNGVEKIGNGALDKYSENTYFVIPASVCVIGEMSAPSNTEIEFKGDEVPDFYYPVKKSWFSGIAIVPKKALAAYKGSKADEIFNDILPLENCSMKYNKGWNWVSLNFAAKEKSNIDAFLECFSSCSHILSKKESVIVDPEYGCIGDFTFSPTEMYKMYFNDSEQVDLEGAYYRAESYTTTMYNGWNWIGYIGAEPMPFSMDNVSLKYVSSGDMIIGQDNFMVCVYDENIRTTSWEGSLMLEPGHGYMYYTRNSNTLRFNSSSVSYSKDMNKIGKQEINSYWSYDIGMYPNTTALIASLSGLDIKNYELAAFADGECRGVARNVSGRFFLPLHGNGNESVSFKVRNIADGTVFNVNETIINRDLTIGSYSSPIQLTLGDVDFAAGISNAVIPTENEAVYNISGQKINNEATSEKMKHLPKGIYIRNGRKYIVR